MPGNTMTEMIETFPEYIETMLLAIPLKRFGTVEEMGHAAAFLASKEAGFITGQTIIIDGGQSLPES
nr:SDR family oxidoreductase [Paenibacillus polymyxa]